MQSDHPQKRGLHIHPPFTCFASDFSSFLILPFLLSIGIKFVYMYSYTLTIICEKLNYIFRFLFFCIFLLYTFVISLYSFFTYKLCFAMFLNLHHALQQ